MEPMEWSLPAVFDVVAAAAPVRAIRPVRRSARPNRQEGRVRPTPEDHVAICDLLARYCLALDAGDVDGWVALFTPDARYEVYGRSFEGHAGLRRMLSGAPGGLHLGG